MAYQKHTWQDGELITHERLNAIENGISDNDWGHKEN